MKTEIQKANYRITIWAVLFFGALSMSLFTYFTGYLPHLKDITQGYALLLFAEIVATLVVFGFMLNFIYKRLEL